MFLSFTQGLVNIDTLRDAVSRLFMVRMKLGEFDPPEMNPYTKWVCVYKTHSIIVTSL